MAALTTAKSAFDRADKFKANLRSVANSADSLRQTAVDQDLSFRKRLIEIFGSPYDGQIGAGKAYPAGYNGPDLSLFMYMDTININSGTVLGVSSEFTAHIEGFRQFIEKGEDALDEGAGDGQKIGKDFKAIYSRFFANDISATDRADAVFFSDSAQSALNLSLPYTVGTYGFRAPPSWGQRSSPGALQTSLADMLQTQVDLEIALNSYWLYIAKLEDMVRLLEAKNDQAQYSIDTRLSLSVKLDSISAASQVLKTTAAGLTFALELGKKVADNSASLLGGAIVGTAFTPTTGLKGIVDSVAASAQQIGRAFAFTFEQSSALLDLSKDPLKLQADLDILESDLSYAIKQQLLELNQAIRSEPAMRLQMFKILEQLRNKAGAYRSKLSEGVRLIEERRNFNIRTATATQQSRYQDYMFRAARSGAMEKYHAAFDLAARYAFLAAKAYDYETNLSPEDRASAQGVFEAIMRARTLGEMDAAEPALGRGGLADALATLRENFRVLKPRMGLNNPQTEGTPFSLRDGLFRIGKTNTELRDAVWRAHLQDLRRVNLWDVPEFRRYCRPFAYPSPRTMARAWSFLSTQ